MKFLTLSILVALMCSNATGQTKQQLPLQTKKISLTTNQIKVKLNGLKPLKGIPAVFDEIIKDKPKGQEVTNIQRSAICSVPENSGAVFKRQSCATANYVIGEDGNLYLYNALGKCYTFSYSKLESKGNNKFIMHTPQAIDMGYNDNNEKIKLYATRLVLNKEGENWVYTPEFKDDGTFNGDINFTFKDGIIRQETSEENEENGLPNVIIGLTDIDGQFQGFSTANIIISPFDNIKTEKPENVEAENSIMSYKDVKGEKQTLNVKIAFTDNNIYLKCPYDFGDEDEKDFKWIKGNIEGDKVIFKSQYIGLSDNENSYVFMAPAESSFRTDEDGTKHIQAKLKDQLEFKYNKENKTLESIANGLMLINEGDKELNPWAAYCEPGIKQYDMTLRKPANPIIKNVSPYDESEGMSVTFDILTKDVDGGYIMPDYLYYNVYFDKDDKPMVFDEETYSGLEKDMIDIPYTFNDGEHFFVKDNTHLFYALKEKYKRVGVQVIHKIGEGVNRSEIVWSNNPTDNINKTINNNEIINKTYFDLTGRKLNSNSKGIYIECITYKNGKKIIKKIIH